jgi:hypothetical protein
VQSLILQGKIPGKRHFPPLLRCCFGGGNWLIHQPKQGYAVDSRAYYILGLSFWRNEADKLGQVIDISKHSSRAGGLTLTTTSGIRGSQLHSPEPKSYLTDFIAPHFFAFGDQKSNFLARNQTGDKYD